jgi:hypothetical protein
MRRAEARATAVASLAGFDARSARQGLARAATASGSRVARADLRRLRATARGRAELVVVWRDLVALLRAPGRAVEAAVLVAGGTALAAFVADKPAAVPVAVLLVYAGGALFLGPLRAELDVPDRTRVLLRPPAGTVVLAHALVAAAAATGAAVLAAAASAIGGADGATAFVAAVVAPGIAACAAMSARRGGRLPASVLSGAVAADPSGGAGAILGWLALWPSVAAIVAGVPLLIVAASGTASLLPAVLWVLAGTGIVAALLRRPPK